MKRFGYLFLVISVSALASPKVATVKLLRGQVSVHKEDKELTLKMNDWVEEGAVVKTSDKSFVKLIFTDKSSMNVGPNSEMKIEKFDGKEAGVIDVVKGQIRSQVTKDYLQIKDHDKSKLFMKTSNAVMGVRGTDFMITTNGKNTSTVLFEGEVVFNSLPERGSPVSAAKLDDIVDRGVRVMPGEFSVVEADRNQPTVPSVINLQQREALEQNVNLETADRSPSSAESENVKSIVPDGLSGESVSNSSENLKSEVGQVLAAESTPTPASTGNAEGFVSGDTVKPANGSFVHLESGTIIPPPAGSVLDPNTNTFIPASGNGMVADDGSFVPPAGVEITNDGKIMVNVTSSDGSMKVVEVQKASPVVTTTSTSLASMSKIIEQSPTLMNSTGPIDSNVLTTAPTVEPTIATAPERILTGPSPMEYQVIQKATRGTLNIEVIKN